MKPCTAAQAKSTMRSFTSPEACGMTASTASTVQVVGGLGRSSERRRLEAVGLAAEHQLEEHGIGGSEGHVADALADQPAQRHRRPRAGLPPSWPP